MVRAREAQAKSGECESRPGGGKSKATWSTPLIFFLLIKDMSSGEITFYMKGADTVMSAIVQYNDWLEEEVMLPGRSGLNNMFSITTGWKRR